MLRSNWSGLSMIDEFGLNEYQEPITTDDSLDDETATLWKAMYHLLKGFGCFDRN